MGKEKDIGKNKEKHFKRLIGLAVAMRPIEFKRGQNYFHVCFVLNKKAVIAIGVNDMNKSHPKLKNYPYKPEVKLHAEFVATSKVKFLDCSGFNLVVLRIDKENKLMNSKPCAGCEAVIREKGFNKIWYSCANNEFHKL